MLKRAFNVHKRFIHSKCIFVEMSEHTVSVNFMGYFKTDPFEIKWSVFIIIEEKLTKKNKFKQQHNHCSFATTIDCKMFFERGYLFGVCK